MLKTKMIEIRNVNIPDKVSKVNAGKYEAMKRILIKILPKNPPGITQSEMGIAVLSHLPQDIWPEGEKSMWWVKTVQLDLEAKGLIIRNRNSKPARWYRR